MSLAISILSIVTFAVTALYMFVRAKFMITRRVASVAALLCVGEIAMIGLLSGVTNLAVMGLLLASRVTVFVCCVMAMRQDREMAKARARRRNRFAVDMINAEYPLKLVQKKRKAASIDVVA